MRFSPVTLSLVQAAVFVVTASAQQTQLVFVENTRSGNVSVIDDATFGVIGTIDVGLSPDDIVSAPDGRMLYLSRIVRRPRGRPAAPGEPLGEVVAIDPRSLAVAWRAPLGGLPNHLITSPDGKLIYVTLVDRGRVDIVDVSRRTVVDSIAAGAGPHDIEVSEDGKTGWVGLIRGAAAVAFDATTRKATQTYPMPDNVRPIAVTHDGKTMFLQLSHTHALTMLDLASGQVVKKIPMPVPPGQVLPDSMPDTAGHGLRVTADGRMLIANGSMYDLVAFFALPEATLIGWVPVGDDPNWIMLTPDGKHAYVSNRASDELSVIEVATRKEIRRIKVGRYPQRMASVSVGTK